MVKTINTLFALVFMCQLTNAQAQDLSKDYEPVRRSISSYSSDGKSGIQVDARQESGVVWIKGKEFSSGTIEFDVMGENKPGSSFVGIAFHGKDNETYDCVYFRPFNFVAEKQINRDHMVQYISLPEYDWELLRNTRTGEFEKEIKNAPDPTKWLHAKVQVKDGVVKVFVNEEKEPSLVVKKLNDRTTGKIGFWAGFNSTGRFANLKISK
jgi:hypothetical protein